MCNQLIDMALECMKTFLFFSQEIQKALSYLQSTMMTEMLSDLQRSLQDIFQEIESELKRFKEKKLTDFINQTLQNINTISDIYISFVFRFLKENLNYNFVEFNKTVLEK